MNEATNRTFRLLIEYDGGGFSGFQKQLNAPKTVQGQLEAALAQLTGVPTLVSGAGRTDAGVHATGQVVSFVTPCDWAPEKLRRGLNALVRPDLAVLRAQVMPAGFHARYAAIWREYRYRLLVSPSPSPLRQRHAHWHGTDPLDIGAMQRVWGQLLGRYDFAAWQNMGADTPDTVCHVQIATSLLVGDELHFRLRADRFLYRMVRNLVGTTLKIGRGKLPEETIGRLLADPASNKGGPAVPPQGLCFEAVGYKVDWPPQGLSGNK